VSYSAAAKSYIAKEIFYTLQGEGAQAGRAAVFCRFAGCNLWSGREEDRAAAVCRFCDTDFVGVGADGGKFATAEELAERIAQCLPGFPGAQMQGGQGTQPTSQGRDVGHPRPFVVCTGGEPLLQLDAALIDALHLRGFEIAVETNGTIAVPRGIDWICVSPKAGAELVQTTGDELKLVYPQSQDPQTGAAPERYAALRFRHFFLQPMDGPDRQENTELAIRYCMEHPQWRLSVQTHKVVGIR